MNAYGPCYDRLYLFIYPIYMYLLCKQFTVMYRVHAYVSLSVRVSTAAPAGSH